MANVSLVEIFERVRKEPKKVNKLSLLKRFNSVALRTYIDLMFNPNVKLNLPDGEYPINEETLVGPPTNRLETVYRSLPAFANKRARQVNLERGWFNVISGLSKKERQFLEAAKDKKVDLGLTYKELREVFPHLPDVGDEVLVETFRFVPSVAGNVKASVPPVVQQPEKEDFVAPVEESMVGQEAVAPDPDPFQIDQMVNEASTELTVDEEEPPKRRGPGRPKGSKNKKKKKEE